MYYSSFIITHHKCTLYNTINILFLLQKYVIYTFNDSVFCLLWNEIKLQLVPLSVRPNLSHLEYVIHFYPSESAYNMKRIFNIQQFLLSFLIQQHTLILVAYLNYHQYKLLLLFLLFVPNHCSFSLLPIYYIKVNTWVPVLLMYDNP